MPSLIELAAAAAHAKARVEDARLRRLGIKIIYTRVKAHQLAVAKLEAARGLLEQAKEIAAGV